MRTGLMAWVLAGALAGTVLGAERPVLTALERSQGWRLLFDGESFDGWHGYAQNRIPPEWSVVEAALVCRGDGLPLVSDATFADFELRFSWRVESGGRAEVYFRLAEDAPQPAQTGVLFELAGPGVVAGGNGGLAEPLGLGPREEGSWQTARLVVFGNQIEYWVNGVQVVGYLLGSREWKEALARSPFREYRDHGRLRDGAVALAGRGAHFRDVRVRRL